MGTVGAKWEDIPKWLQFSLREDVEGSIDGVRWVASPHLAFAVAGGTWHVLPGVLGDLVPPASNRAHEMYLGAYVVDVYEGAALSPDDSSRETCEQFAHAGHYAITWADVSISLYYATVIQKMFGAVEWFGVGPLDPVVARKGGHVVAVVMPLRREGVLLTIGEEATQAAPQEATAEARGE